MVTPGMTLPAPQDDPRAARLQRVRRQSGVMATTSAAIIILLGAVMLLYWCLTPADMLFRHAGLVPPPPTEVAFTTRLAAFTVAMIPLGALIVGLLSARRCFTCFAVGRIYSGDAARSLRGFALGVGASAPLKPAAALSLMLSALPPAHTRSLVLNVGSDTLLPLLFAAMVAIIAGVLVEAAEVSAEIDRFA